MPTVTANRIAAATWEADSRVGSPCLALMAHYGFRFGATRH